MKKGQARKVAPLTWTQNMQQAPRGRYPSLPHGQQLQEAVKIHSHLEPAGCVCGGGRHGDWGWGVAWVLPDTETPALRLQKANMGQRWEHVYGRDSGDDRHSDPNPQSSPVPSMHGPPVYGWTYSN